MMDNLFAKVRNSFQVFRPGLSLCETYVTLAQAPGKAGRTIALGQFNFVEHNPDFLRRERRMIKKVNELFNGPLEVNVVLPEGVISVDQ
jgi:hypothetical protein